MNTNTNEQTISNSQTIHSAGSYAEALAKWLGCEVGDLCEERFDCYGLTVLEDGNDSYAIGTDSECDKACAVYIQDTLWAFNAEFIVEQCGLPHDFAEVIRLYQEKKCEDANEALVQLVSSLADFAYFVRKAIAADGRGHFLASYDGDEIDLGGGMYAYKIG